MSRQIEPPRFSGRVTLWEEPDTERVLPWELELCGACRGRGSSSAYLGAFSGRRLAEARADTEFWEDYVSGRLDRPCESCDGKGRVAVVDRKRCSKADLEVFDRQENEEAEYQAMSRAERLFEGGWREEGWFDD